MHVELNPMRKRVDITRSVRQSSPGKQDDEQMKEDRRQDWRGRRSINEKIERAPATPGRKPSQDKNPPMRRTKPSSRAPLPDSSQGNLKTPNELFDPDGPWHLPNGKTMPQGEPFTELAASSARTDRINA
jgi:hypothetical protein